MKPGPELPTFSEVTREPGLTYSTPPRSPSSTQSTPLKLDLYYPADDTRPARPAMVIAHGGMWQQQPRKFRSPFYQNWATQMATRGFVVAVPQYRYWEPQTSRLDISMKAGAADLRAAIRFLHSRANELAINPERILLAGYSAGAISALWAAYGPEELEYPNDAHPGESRKIFAVIASAGGWLQEGARRGQPWGIWRDNADMIDKGESHLLVIHGTEDRLVPFSQAENSLERARGQGLGSKLIKLNGGHEVFRDRFSSLRDSILNFYRAVRPE